LERPERLRIPTILSVDQETDCEPATRGKRRARRKLTLELQALLPPGTTLKDACTVFKSLDDCVASLHASHQPEESNSIV